MKKLVLIIAFLAVALGASAKFRWGPTAGVNICDYDWRQNLMGNSSLAGFRVGAIGEVMIPGIGFGFDFGLMYVNHGGRVDFSDQFVWESTGIKDTDLRMHVLQVPVNLRFKWTRMNGIENYVAPFVYGGPQFNFNLAHTKCEAVEMKAMTVALTCGIGVELWRRYQISAGYYWNMTNDFETVKLDNLYARMRGWTVDFTVLF